MYLPMQSEAEFYRRVQEESMEAIKREAEASDKPAGASYINMLYLLLKLRQV